MKQRIVWIDWAKSICMFLVVMGHCHIQPSMHLIQQIIYSFHIPLFFFFSGLLRTKEYTLVSLKKDINYIIIPYFVFGLFQIIIHSILTKDFSFLFFWGNTKLLLCGTDASIGAIWFLPALFICKLLFLILQEIWQKTIIPQIIIIILSLFPAYFISLYNINIPLFTDSALFGLPFFFIGSTCLPYINIIITKSISSIASLTTVFLILTIILSIHNGFVCVASCEYGDNLLMYYLNSMTGIVAIIGICLLLNKFHFEFITTTSYGTVVTLGFHGIFLLFLQYYIPKLAGFYTSTISIPIAIIYSTITYILCYYIIKYGDRYCPQLLGLRGSLLRRGINP